MSRPTPLAQQTFDSLDAMMLAWSAEAVRIAAQDHGMDLDFSPDSVARLETVIAARSPVPADQQDEVTRLWGSYFGEIFRRRYDSHWTMAVYPGQLNSGRSDAGTEMSMPALDIRGSHVYPLLKVFRRLTIGPAEDLSAFYGRVTAALDANAQKKA
ncbi:MAG TPA: hypothetical protein VHX13_03770 [Acidobacteriaceae bacterium]|jgi:hypothetical protein|nr:hypothetical protein [Acidobacteriaceae bacterium]